MPWVAEILDVAPKTGLIQTSFGPSAEGILNSYNSLNS